MAERKRGLEVLGAHQRVRAHARPLVTARRRPASAVKQTKLRPPCKYAPPCLAYRRRCGALVASISGTP
jgi:hypothetical protein